MDILQEVLKNGKYKQQLDRLDDETLKRISEDNVQALKAAQKGVQKEEPERTNDIDYLQAIADSMQKLAVILIEKRMKETS